MIPPYKSGIFTAQDTRGEAQDLLRLAVAQRDSTRALEALELLSDAADAPWTGKTCRVRRKTPRENPWEKADFSMEHGDFMGFEQL